MVNHINHALVAKAHTPMYLIHKYWARKPHNVVHEYIKNYTQEDEIVLDPFCGSGVTPIEAIKLGRKGIGFDLNPVAILISKLTAIPLDPKKMRSIFSEIEKKCKDDIQGLYKTICPKCKSEAFIVYTIKQNDEIIEIGYECKKCMELENTSKRFLIKKPESYDFELLKRIEDQEIPYWYPTSKLAYKDEDFKEGTHDPNIESVDKLFDKRALISLSILYNQIEKIRDKKLKEIFKLIFTSNVHTVSKLNPVHKPRWDAGEHPSTSWIVHRFWVPKIRVECPVWFYFKERFNHIVEAKIDSNNQIEFFKEAKNFDALNNHANFLIKTNNALELEKLVPSNSVDYIFTDPPYGGEIQYLELSTIWAAWLKIDQPFADEITINPNQDKNFDSYHNMLRAAFRQMFMVLKPGKYLTVTFHSSEIKVWNSIIRAVVLSGFDLEKIVYQPPARPSAKGLFQPFGSAVGDYYIRFKKPEIENSIDEKQIDLNRYEREVIFAAKKILEKRGEPTIFQHILNGIMIELKGGRYAPLGARNFTDILRDHLTDEFELIGVFDKNEKRIGEKWWLKNRDFSNTNIPPLSDRVERAIISVLDKKFKASFDDILQSIFIEFPNALTPETHDVKRILSEYADETTDGKWRLKPQLSSAYRETEHTKIVYILANLGKKAGFNIWIGQKEQGDVYNGTSLKEFCDDIHYFKNTHPDDSIQDRIKQIDVLWVSDGCIKYEFEVEYTTGISEAIIRGSNIPDNTITKRFIIIPKEREKFLFRKIQEQLLRDALKKTKWDFIRFEDLEELNILTKKRFSPSQLNKLCRLPSDTKNVQSSLSFF